MGKLWAPHFYSAFFVFLSKKIIEIRFNFIKGIRFTDVWAKKYFTGLFAPLKLR